MKDIASATLMFIRLLYKWIKKEQEIYAIDLNIDCKYLLVVFSFIVINYWNV